MNIRAVIAIIGMICLIIWIRKQKQGTGTDAAFFDSARLQGEISALHRASQELEQLDELIIDLRLCRPEELHRVFRINWQGATGKDHALDFVSTGTNANTEHMLELAEGRREELNTEIQARIADLYSRAQSMEFFADYDAERSRSEAECSIQNSEQNSAEGECLH